MPLEQKMESRRAWTDKMLMAALILGVAGAAARSTTPPKADARPSEAKKRKKELPLKGNVEPRLARLMLEFERAVKEQLKPGLKQSESGSTLPPPREKSPRS